MRSSGRIEIKEEFADDGSVEEIGEVKTQVVGIIEKLENEDKKEITKEEDDEGEYGGQQIITVLALLDMGNEVLQEMTSVPENCRTTYFFMQSFEAKLAQYFGITQRRLVDLYKHQVNFRPGNEMKVAKVVTEGMERVEKEGMVYMVRKNMPKMVSSSECESEIVCDDCLEGENEGKKINEDGMKGDNMEEKTLPKVDGDKRDGQTKITGDKSIEETAMATEPEPTLKVDDKSKKKESEINQHAEDKRDGQTKITGHKPIEETAMATEPEPTLTVDDESKKTESEIKHAEDERDGHTKITGDKPLEETATATEPEPTLKVDDESKNTHEHDGQENKPVKENEQGGLLDEEQKDKEKTGKEDATGQIREEGDKNLEDGNGLNKTENGDEKIGEDGDGLDTELNVDQDSGNKNVVDGDGLETEDTKDQKLEKKEQDGDGLRIEKTGENKTEICDGIEGATNLDGQTGLNTAGQSDGRSAGENNEPLKLVDEKKLDAPDGHQKGSAQPLSTGIPIFSPQFFFCFF